MPDPSIRSRLEALVREHFAGRDPLQPQDSLPLVADSIQQDEVMAVIDTLLDGRITMGPRVAELEAAWSRWLGVPASLMVNSGSSANLLGLAALAHPEVEGRLEPGDEVLVPAICWSTSVFPILQAGLKPVFVDVDPDTLNLDAARCEAALSDRTRAIVVIHLLGNPCPMDELMALAERRGLFLFEDCCEAHGATFADQRVGSFGDLSSFSFYFSHHMTTGEGGMLSMRDPARFGDLSRSLRAHGWVRDREDRDEWIAKYPGIDSRWLFVSQGYNVRSTDINAAIGLVQLGKIDQWIAERMRVRQGLAQVLAPFVDRLRFQVCPARGQHSGFGFSMILRPEAKLDRPRFMAALERGGVEGRPLVGGNMARQPVAASLGAREAGPLVAADLAHDHGLMIGIHPEVTPRQIEHVGLTVQRALAAASTKVQAPVSGKRSATDEGEAQAGSAE